MKNSRSTKNTTSQVTVLRQLLELRNMQDPFFDLDTIQLTITGRCTNGEHQRLTHKFSVQDPGARGSVELAIFLIQQRIEVLQQLNQKNS